ncbi:phage tail protein [Nonomuraea sp. NPDC050556]|uniref:phage tail protein n=1 Tax=Nonomuraea sp. NPDC050556 TaxID=3364369 RepID=UPI0037AC4111
MIGGRQPGVQPSGELTLSESLGQGEAFADWVKTRPNADEPRATVTVAMLDSSGSAVRRLRLTNGSASTWTGADPNASNEIETVTIAYDEINVE